jgi:hypothetical protein
MSAAQPETTPEPSWLAPSWGRLLVAAGVAVIGFLLPQEVPLEWYPLNNPGTDINYLEVSCASNVNGEVIIRYDVSRFGNRPFDNITIPISPTTQTFTYTFPLPDLPIVELRIQPPKDGELTIRQMRIINRRNEEIRRFTRDLFRAEREIAGIEPLPEGWKIIAAPGASSSSTRIELFSHIVPVGMNHRNLLRCLLSTGYLAGMLFILLMAVLTATCRPRSWRDFFLHAGFMAGLAVLFAPVGNRGLIRNSYHFSRYVVPVPPPGLKLEMDLTTEHSALQAQIFWDLGAGLSEVDSTRAQPEPHSNQQTLRFVLPDRPIQGLRFDPLNGATKMVVRGVRLVDVGQRTRLVLPLDLFTSVREIARLEVKDDQLLIETTADATDPILGLKPEALAQINAALGATAPEARRPLK